MPAWALIALFMAAVGVSAFSDFAAGATTQIVLTLLGVLFTAAIYLARIRFEALIRDAGLVFRSRLVVGSLLNWPWSERRVPWRSIDSFTLYRDPWSDQKTLTISLDDGSSLEIRRPRSVGGSDTFDDFVAAFRLVVRKDPGSSRIQENGRFGFPVLHAIVGAVVVAMGVMSLLALRDVMDQESAMIAAIFGLMIVVAGVRVFLQNV